MYFQLQVIISEEGISQDFTTATKVAMGLVIAFNFLGAILISDGEGESMGLIAGVGCSGLMIGMAVMQFQNAGIEYSTQSMTEFFDIYLPSMFLIFGFFQCFYCFLRILKSYMGFWKVDEEIEK